METTREGGLTPLMTAQFANLLLTLVVAWILSIVLHQQRVMFMLLFVNWTASIFTFANGPPSYRRIIASAAVGGVIAYLLHRYYL